MSKLDEMNTRRATHSMTARINAKYLATLIVFWRSKGIEGNSSSQLVRLSLETFTEFLVKNNSAIMIESTSEALDIISKCGYKIGRTSSKAIVDELISEDASLDFLTSTNITSTVKKTPAKITPSDLETAQALMKQREDENLKDRIKESQNSTSEILTNLKGD